MYIFIFKRLGQRHYLQFPYFWNVSGQYWRTCHNKLTPIFLPDRRLFATQVAYQGNVKNFCIGKLLYHTSSHLDFLSKSNFPASYMLSFKQLYHNKICLKIGPKTSVFQVLVHLNVEMQLLMFGAQLCKSTGQIVKSLFRNKTY